MMPLNMETLENCFKAAISSDYAYVAVRVVMDGFPEAEVIINSNRNIEAKLAYYKNTYNDDLTHKFSQGIRIAGFTFGDTYEEIEEELAY